MANDLNIVYKIAADITGLKQGVDRAASATEKLTSSATKVAAAFGVAFSAQAVIGFGKELLADADALVKLSDKTGLSLQALQKFQIAGDEAGNSIDQLTGAVAKMEDKLVSGDKSALGALSKLNLSLADLKGLSPEDQFIKISDALRTIQDPAEQVNIAIDLFGKQGAEILPTLKRGFDDLKDAVVGMSDHTVRSLDRAGDQLDAFWRSFKSTAANAAVDTLDLIAGGFTAAGVAAARADDAAAAEMDRLKQHIEQLRLAAVAAVEFSRPVTGFVGPVFDAALQGREAEARIKAQDEAAQKAATSLKSLADAERAYQAERAFAGFVRDAEAANELADRLDDAQMAFDQFVMAAENANAAFTPLLQSSQTLGQIAVPTVTSSMGDLRKMVGGAETDLGDLAQAFAQLAQVSGGSFGGIVKDLGQVVNAIHTADEAFKVLGSTSSASFAAIAAAASTTLGVLAAFVLVAKALGGQDKQVAREQNRDAAVTALWDRIRQMQEAGTLLQVTPEQQAEFQKLQALLNMPGTPDNLAAVAAQLERINGLLDTMESLARDANAQFGPSKSELQAAAQRAHDLFDFMQKKAAETGEYTQAQLDKAFVAFQRALAATGDEAAKAWLKAHDAAEAAGQASSDALDKLKSKRDSLTEALSHEAPEAVMGVIETQMRGELAALNSQIADQQQQTEDAATTAAGVINDTVGGAAEDVRDRLGLGIEDGLGTAGPAAAAARSDIEGAFAGLSFDIPYRFYQEGPGVPSLPVVPMATGGDFWVTKPTLFMAGEAGPERATFSPAGGGSDQPIVVQSFLDGQLVAENFIARAQGNKRGLGTKLRKVLA